MAQTKQAKISDLVPDDRNFNKHSEYGMSLLEKSVGKFGMGRSILLDKNNRIIAGNGITETAGQLGFEDVEIVESDGSKIIAVKRTDIDLDSPEGRELALADNATNKANLRLDTDMVFEELGQDIADEWGIKEWEAEDLGLSSEGKEGEEGYDEFKEKFEQKLTTDDCYTPQPIYEAVCEWVDKNITPLKGRQIIRPFFPGGDYEHHNYPEGCIVIDNPPFSISAKILDFYLGRGIPFFLFGNGLTLASTKREGLTYVIVGEGIVFENGANINIGFYTNLCPEVRIWLAGDLAAKIREVQKAPESLPNIKWDIHIQSAALLSKIAKRVNLKIMADECELIGGLSTGQAIFGGGVILSDTAARQADEARRQADEARRQADEARGVSGALGEKEREIVRKLNRKSATS